MKVQDLLDNIENIKSMLDPSDGDGRITFPVNEIFTEYAIQKLIATLKKFMKWNPTRALLQEHIDVILELLGEFFEVIRGTNAVAPQDPHSLLTRTLLSLAHQLEPIVKRSRYQILMPRINVVDYEASSTSLNDDELQITDFVLSDDETSIIEIYPCLSFASEDGILKHTRLFDGQIKVLSEDEKSRVIHHSKESELYWNAIQYRIDITTRSESYGAVLRRLCNDLRKGGAAKGGQELNAGADANVGIKNFFDWYNALTIEQRANLAAFRAYGLTDSLATLLDRLARPQDEDYRETIYCVEMIAGNIETILNANQQLFNLCSLYKSFAFQLGIEQATANVTAAGNALKKAMTSLNYRVNAHGNFAGGALSVRMLAEKCHDLASYVSKKGLHSLFSTPDDLLAFMKNLPIVVRHIGFFSNSKMLSVIGTLQYNEWSEIESILATLPYKDRQDGLLCFQAAVLNLIHNNRCDLENIINLFTPSDSDSAAVLKQLLINRSWFQQHPVILFRLLEMFHCKFSNNPEHIMTINDLKLIFDNSNVIQFIALLNKPESKAFQRMVHKSLAARFNKPSEFSGFILDLPTKNWGVVVEVLCDAQNNRVLAQISNTLLLSICQLMPEASKSNFLESCSKIIIENCLTTAVLKYIIITATNLPPPPLGEKFTFTIGRITAWIIKLAHGRLNDSLAETFAAENTDVHFVDCMTIMAKFSGIAALKDIPNIEIVAANAQKIVALIDKRRREKLEALQDRPLLFRASTGYSERQLASTIGPSHDFKNDTVAALESYGLTKEYLITHLVLPDLEIFNAGHKDILIYLVTGVPVTSCLDHDKMAILDLEQRLTPAQAIEEINNLCVQKIGALGSLYAHGLRGNHLRDYQLPLDDGHWLNRKFHGDHIRTLRYLITEREPRLTPIQAMQWINGLTHDEVRHIRVAWGVGL